MCGVSLACHILCDLFGMLDEILKMRVLIPRLSSSSVIVYSLLLYGLVQSACKWYEHLKVAMLKFDYKRSALILASSINSMTIV